MIVAEAQDLENENAKGQSLKHLRLVNRRFSNAATPLLFQTVGLWIGLNSLSKFAALSKHPEMYFSRE